jgi:class 3 adenylate cyclase
VTRPPEQEFPERAERKLATVLFADLVSSTERGASEDPERTRALLDRFYDAMTAELVDAGGTVEKFVGDAVMAAFGVPVAQEDHVERALHAALAMQRRLEQTFGGELSLRIGVNSGEVVVGAAREKSSFVSGDAVNVAARLEQAACPGDVLVGARAAELVSGAFEFEAPMRAEAKGKPGGVECRKLVRALSLMRPRGVPGLKRAFVGRDHELSLVQEAFVLAAERRKPQLVTIMGEPGVGKTRLVRELWEWLGGEAFDMVRRTGRCMPYGLARTYGPISEILKEHYGILDSDSTERILALFGERELLGLALGLDVAGELHPIDARDRLHDAWIDFVAELAAERPLVLLVEDLHWGEEPLFELLERMLLEIRAPVFLLATARPEFLELSPTWGRGRVASEWIWLEPLTGEDIDRMITSVISADVPEAARALLRRAEGNPLFVEELLTTLIEHGALDVIGRWDVARVPADAALPDSVHAVLAARIDMLLPEDKAALQAAAVIGRVFWPNAVRELLGGAEPDFGALERRDFIRRSSGSSLGGEREFAFKHALTREVAYGSLTRRDRARLHGDLGAWLERRGGSRDEDAGRLALHYAESVRPEDSDLAWGDEPDRYEELRAKAVTWLRRAAELAAGRYEIVDALALLERALALGLDRRENVEILHQTALTHMLRYDMQGLRDSMEAALALEPEQPVAAEIYAQLAYYTLGRPYMWERPPARKLGEEWLARALELSRPGTGARGFAAAAQALSQPETGSQAADEALAIGQSLGHPLLVGSGFEAKTLVATAAGDFAEACTWADRALEATSYASDPGYRAARLWIAGLAHLRAGRTGEVRRLADAHGRIAPTLGPHDEVHALAHQALLESVLGRWDALAELATRAETTAAANAEFPCQFNWRTLIVCALGAAQLDRSDEVDRLVELGRSGAVVVGPVEREPALLRLALLRGDLEDAERMLELLPAAGDPWGLDGAAARLDALAALGRTRQAELEAAPFLDRESYTRPFALRALGLVRADPSLVDQAVACFESIGLEWRAAETRALAAAAQ